MSAHPPSPLRNGMSYSPPSSPASLRAPGLPTAPRSPAMSRHDIMSESSRGWSTSGGPSTLTPRRPVGGYSSTGSESEGGQSGYESVRGASGAEGGPGAIGERRRQSNSFKTMSTGSLVSNSIFTKQQGSSTAPLTPGSGSLYGGSSRAPHSSRGPSGSTRKTSGGNSKSRKVSGDKPHVNENAGGNRKVSGEKDEDATSPRSAPASPSTPFRPIRNISGTPSSSTAAGSTPYRPNWAATAAPRQSSSYAASRQNALVTSSPFITQPISAPASTNSERLSPSCSSPRDANTHQSFNSGMGLGIRPGGPLATNERRFGGASVPPSATPPQGERSSPSITPPTVTRFDNQSRKLRDGNGDGEETETEEERRVLRKKPSTKTVTWATTEEVLEFEVEEERRRSTASEMSGSTASEDDADQYSDTGDDSLLFDRSNGSMIFNEGSTLDLQDMSNQPNQGADDASTVEDMMGEIESFMDDEISKLTPPQPQTPFDSRQVALDLASLSNAVPDSGYDTFAKPSPRSFVVQSNQRNWETSPSIAQSTDDETASTSSYDDDDEEVSQAARAVTTARKMLGKYADSSPEEDGKPFPNAPSFLDVSSRYSLPDLPSNSPFLGFSEGSEVRITPTASPRPASQHGPTQSTPTKALASPSANSSIQDSPILSHFAEPRQEHLSRQASIQTAISTASDGGIVRAGSIRGAGRLRQGREEFDERMRRNQAYLNGETLLPSVSSSPSPHPLPLYSPPAIPVAVMSPSPPLQPQIIAARPALKARSATISTEMLSTIAGSPSGSQVIGDPLTEELARGMESPLDRLQRGAGRMDDPLPRTPDVSDSEPGSATSVTLSATDARALAILQRKRERGGMEDGMQWASRSSEDTKPLVRRRSLSTGDAARFERTPKSEKRATVPVGFGSRLNDALPASESAFALTVGSSLDNVYRNSQHPKYRVRETHKVVYANDGLLNANLSAGDVDPGRAWRKKRPSDMHLSITSADIKSLQEEGALNGQIFVSLIEARFDDLPIPAQPTSVICWLDNGRQRVQAGTFPLASKITFNKEFELTSSAALSFSIDLQIPSSAAINPHLLKPTPPTVPTPLSPTKSPSRFRSAFGSPKKKVPTWTPPVPERVLQYLSHDGNFATTQIDFKNEASNCRAKPCRLQLPFKANGPGNRSAAKTCVGTIIVDLFHVPSIPGIARADLPKSVGKAAEGVNLAQWHGNVHHEGVLTQMGGDCLTWRRRHFKAMGSRMVPYNEITKKAYVEIDLSKVIAIEDPNAASSCVPGSKLPRSSSQDLDESPWRMDNSIKLVFRQDEKKQASEENREEILFFADTKEEKDKWIEVLGKLAGAAGYKDAPEWAVVLRKLQLQLGTPST